MSLDFRIKNDDRVSSPQLSLSVEDHWELVTIAKDMNLILLQRFYDYYEEGEVNANEIDSFLIELNRLEQIAKPQKPKEIVKGLIALSLEAKSRKEGIKAWPD